jgi:peptide/nickel transport system permease protein
VSSLEVEATQVRNVDARSVWRMVRRNPVTATGFAIILMFIAIAILAPLIAPYGATEVDPSAVLESPSWSHLFGTGTFGEDIFSRVLYGARYDLAIGFGAVLIGLVIGCAIGAAAGFFADPADEILMRIMDMIAAFPSFILAMGIAAALGPSLPNLRWHLLPNTWTPIFVQSTLQFGYAILDAAGLSFIGLGVHLPAPEWGVMVALGIEQIARGQWWVSFFPGLAIALCVMGFNLIGDGLRDLLDPRRR